MRHFSRVETYVFKCLLLRWNVFGWYAHLSLVFQLLCVILDKLSSKVVNRFIPADVSAVFPYSEPRRVGNIHDESRPPVSFYTVIFSEKTETGSYVFSGCGVVFQYGLDAKEVEILMRSSSSKVILNLKLKRSC